MSNVTVTVVVIYVPTKSAIDTTGSEVPLELQCIVQSCMLIVLGVLRTDDEACVKICFYMTWWVRY